MTSHSTILTQLEDQARSFDAKDDLAQFKKHFFIPADTTYLVGHSLGLPSVEALQLLDEVSRQWRELAVESWWDKQEASPVGPWLSVESRIQPFLAELLGANPADVTVMNALGVNLHFLLHSLYRPNGNKAKIVCARSMFPQDRWMLEQHLKLPGNENGSILWLDPRPGETLLREEDIVKLLNDQRDSIALILLEAVSYVTSQAYDLEKIAAAAKKNKVIFIVDLAHSAFVAPLKLNEWGIDGAVGCSYKFGCSGPGGIGIFYINETHWKNPDLWRPGGWWGNDRSTQFEMGPKWQPANGAAAWQVSTLPIVTTAPFLGAIQLFHKAGIKKIQKKCIEMTSYFIRCLDALGNQGVFRILTPRSDMARAAEVAVEFKDKEVAKKLKESLRKAKILVDYRESPFAAWPESDTSPGIIRTGMHPLFNGYMDVFVLVKHIAASLS